MTRALTLLVRAFGRFRDLYRDEVQVNVIEDLNKDARVVELVVRDGDALAVAILDRQLANALSEELAMAAKELD